MTKKPKVKFFKTVSDLKAEKMINEFLSQAIAKKEFSAVSNKYGIFVRKNEI